MLQRYAPLPRSSQPGERQGHRQYAAAPGRVLCLPASYFDSCHRLRVSAGKVGALYDRQIQVESLLFFVGAGAGQSRSGSSAGRENAVGRDSLRDRCRELSQKIAYGVTIMAACASVRRQGKLSRSFTGSLPPHPVGPFPTPCASSANLPLPGRQPGMGIVFALTILYGSLRLQGSRWHTNP